MCGISGILGKNIGTSFQYKEKIQKMTDAIIHRGPDDEGHEFFNDCVMGFRRLSIVDLSSDGHQPMYSFDKKKCITFNGEIYGYREIKKQLSNYPFKSNTDTEVILALYEKYGKEMLEKLTGMFAFAIWDDEKKELFCGRDRFGEKPFFYAFGENGEFLYASEIKSILSTGLIQPKICKKALAHYLKYSFLHPNQSIYENIFVLPPAHTLLYKDGKIKVEKYWNLPTEELNISEEDALKKFKELMETSIKKQMIADVNVGAFLSGGLDSGTVVALSSKHTEKLSTIGFAYEGSWNEMPEARLMAKRYNCQHTEVYMNENQLAPVLEEVITKLDEPLGDTAVPAAYKVCEKASENTTVVITGNAGDELFAGYKWYQKELEILNKGKVAPQLLPFYKIGAILADKLKWKSLHKKMNNAILKAKFPTIIDYQKNNVHHYFSQDEINKLGINEKVEVDYGIPLDENNLNSCMNMDLVHILPGDYLVKDDRIAMLHSIELRTPFLDKDLVEFCTALPSKYKINEKQRKIILRKAFGHLLEKDILSKKKQGFGAPVSQWLKTESMEELTHKYLKNKNAKIYQYLVFSEVQKYINYTYKHWSLLVLAIWFETRNF